MNTRVMNKMAAAHEKWILRPRPTLDARIRLFCFPYSGASASIFRGWAELLPPSLEVCLAQLPGRGARLAELSYTRLGALVEAAAEAILPYLDRPFAFFGHSMGALVSFELARCLHRGHGLSAAYLFVSGHNGPQVPDLEPPIHALPDRQFIDALRRLNGMSPEILQNRELMELLLPILRADFEVCETYAYRHRQPLSCPICACGGWQDPYLSREGLEAWGKETNGPFSVRMFPGDHFYLDTERHLLLRSLAQLLTCSPVHEPSARMQWLVQGAR